MSVVNCQVKTCYVCGSMLQSQTSEQMKQEKKAAHIQQLLGTEAKITTMNFCLSNTTTTQIKALTASRRVSPCLCTAEMQPLNIFEKYALGLDPELAAG